MKWEGRVEAERGGGRKRKRGRGGEGRKKNQ